MLACCYKAMNLNQWRDDGGSIKDAAKLKQNKTFKLMFEVLKNELPTNQTLPAIGTDSHSFAYAYGVEVGYRQCLFTMELMSQPLQEVEDIKATFEDKQ